MPDSFRSLSRRDAVVAHRSHTSWGIEVGSFRCAVTRTRDIHGASPSAPLPASRPAASRARPFTAGALAGVGGVALLVVGASAAPSAVATDRYMVSVPVPAVVSHVIRPRPRAPSPGRAIRPKPLAAAITGERFDAADEPYVARAMATGAFQEWQGADGLPRFLTAGPARVANGRACRDLALLVRFAGGGSHVRTAERCTPNPVSDADAVVEDAPVD